MNFGTLHDIADRLGRGHYKAAARRIDNALKTETGPSWHRSLGALAVFLRDPEHAPFAAILAQGNSKLPFLSFSVLPGVSCPGAGDCLDWCYSFKSWRFPAAFARQAQNLVLIKSKPAHIFKAFDKYFDGNGVVLRLYVDGDFDSVETVNLWFDFLEDNPWLSVYGYSKSYQAIINARQAPNNYRLNISSGHNSSPEIVAQIEALAMTRGHFKAVNLGYNVKAADHGNRGHQARLRAAYNKRAFTCPGHCGTCTPGGHACGSSKFDNVDIIIAAH